MAQEQKLRRFFLHFQYLENRGDSLLQPCVFLLSAYSAAFGLLHIGQEQKSHYPQSPEGKDTQKEPYLQSAPRQGKNPNDSAD